MAALQAIRDALDTSGADQKKAQEQLDFLMDMARSKLQLYTIDLRDTLAGVATNSNDPVKIVGEPIAFQEAYNCNVSSKVNDGISKAVGAFFTGSSDGVKKGFESLISVGLETILGDTSMGESEQLQTFITMEHNAIIRVDTKVWRYNFSDKSIIGTIQNALCYVFCKSVVDHSKVSVDVLTYLISQQAGDDPTAVKAYITELRKIWATLEGNSPDGLRANFVKALA